VYLRYVHVCISVVTTLIDTCPFAIAHLSFRNGVRVLCTGHAGDNADVHPYQLLHNA